MSAYGWRRCARRAVVVSPEARERWVFFELCPESPWLPAAIDGSTVPRMVTPSGWAGVPGISVGVAGMVGVFGTGGVNGTAAGGTMTAGAAVGNGAFPPPAAGTPWLAHSQPHIPQNLQRFGTRAPQVGLPQIQPPRGDERGDDLGGGIWDGPAHAENSAA